MIDIGVQVPEIWRGRLWFWSLLMMAAFSLVGCEGQPPRFSANQVYIQRLSIEIGESLPGSGVSFVEDALQGGFGTPNSPELPEPISLENGDSEGLFSLERLNQAAGPVYSDEQDKHFGLYRKHCFRCHGLTGDGRGPAARLLNPYPRDFRLGKFKFKSTPLGTKPTREDLATILRNGIPGTSMPSFQLLREEEIDALVEYVIYLSVRGETEREMLRRLAFDVSWEPADYDSINHNESLDESRDSGRESTTDPEPEFWASQLDVSSIASEIARKWIIDPLDPPSRPEGFPVMGDSSELSEAEEFQLKLSVDRGRELFTSDKASCSKCHGPNAEGGVFVKDHDDWTKDWTLAIGIDPEDRSEIRPLIRAGALKPVPISARNLQWSAFRGGDKPEQLFYRIAHGIEGTPMPSLPVESESDGGFSSDQVWDLVNYLYSLSHQTMVSLTEMPGGSPSTGSSLSEGGQQ